MEETCNYVKQTQKDYSMSLKFQIVQEIELEQRTATDVLNIRLAAGGGACIKLVLNK